MTISIQLVEMDPVGAVGQWITKFIDSMQNFNSGMLYKPSCAEGSGNPLRRLQKYLEIMSGLSDFLRDLTVQTLG